MQHERMRSFDCHHPVEAVLWVDHITNQDDMPTCSIGTLATGVAHQNFISNSRLPSTPRLAVPGSDMFDGSTRAYFRICGHYLHSTAPRGVALLW